MRRYSQKGYAAIVSVLIMLSVCLVVVSGLAVSMLANLRIAENSLQGMRAFQTAEAGLERIIADWINDPTPEAGLGIYTDEPFWISTGSQLGTYSIDVYDLGNGNWQVDSTGNSGRAERRVRATVLVSLSGPHSSYQKAVFSKSSFDIPSGSEIWGDVYIAGVVVWDNGYLYATNESGEHFSGHPTLADAPYGKLVYYYTGKDTWLETEEGKTDYDAHGYWDSAEGDEIKKESVWLNKDRNTGDSDHSDAGQYWDRDQWGAETLSEGVKSWSGEKTGIAIKDTSTPENFPEIGNGSYSNFVAEYNALAPSDSRFDNLTIYEDEECTIPIRLANGHNIAIIGTEQNGNGFPMQFTWTGTAIRDNETEYSGPLIFKDDALLYVDGDVSISDDIGNDSLTVVSSGDVLIDSELLPQENFSAIVFNDLEIDTNQEMHGVYFTQGSLTMDSNPDIYGILISEALNLVGGATRITYVGDQVFEVSQWLPGGSSPTVQLISWNEVGLE